jgi:hypothetical protein
MATKKNNKSIRRRQMNFLNKFLTALFILGPGTMFGLMNKPTEMGIAIVAGALTVAFFNIDKFERFKGAGFEAEMKKAVDEIYATTENLKSVTKPLLVSIMANLTYAGRWGGMNIQEKMRLKEELRKLAESLEVQDKEVQMAIETFERYHTWDHFNYFTSNLHKNGNIPDELINTFNKELKDFSSSNFPSKELIIERLGEYYKQMKDTDQELLEDYFYYKDNKKLRRTLSLADQ